MHEGSPAGRSCERAGLSVWPQWLWSWADPHPAVERGSWGASGRDQTLRYPCGKMGWSWGLAKVWVSGLDAPEGGRASYLEEAGPCHLEVADKGLDAVSLCWPVVFPQRQPFGREFLPETPLSSGAECLAEGAAVAMEVLPGPRYSLELWLQLWGIMCGGAKALPGGQVSGVLFREFIWWWGSLGMGSTSSQAVRGALSGPFPWSQWGQNAPRSCPSPVGPGPSWRGSSQPTAEGLRPGWAGSCRRWHEGRCCSSCWSLSSAG